MKPLVWGTFMLGILMFLSADSDATELRTDVVGCGGAYVLDANYAHWGTLGQGAVGSVSNAFYVLGAGFWYPTFGHVCAIPESWPDVPAEFALHFANGNPAGVLGSVVFAVPIPGHVSIRLFDVTGREVHRVVKGHMEVGYHQAALNTSGLVGGVYFCRMEAQGFSTTKKLVLLR